jgi:predicted secreted protein
MELIARHGIAFFASLMLVWWIMFLIVIAASPAQGVGEFIPGQEQGAPHQPKLGKKIAITTAISLPLTSLIYGLFATGTISLRGMLGI